MTLKDLRSKLFGQHLAMYGILVRDDLWDGVGDLDQNESELRLLRDLLEGSIKMIDATVGPPK